MHGHFSSTSGIVKVSMTISIVEHEYILKKWNDILLSELCLNTVLVLISEILHWKDDSFFIALRD